MEPVPETLEAVLLLNLTGESEVGVALGDMGRRALTLVPSLVGLSLTTVQDDITLTLVASNDVAVDLDVAQYLDDGPCVEATREDRVVGTSRDDVLDEGQWRLFARAEAALGVASTLSLPLRRDDRIVGGVNLYAREPDAFDGKHQSIAAALGGAAAEVVTNADLSFDTRRRAAEAPAKIRQDDAIHQAKGALAAMHEIGIEEASQLLREAAARVGISEARTAAVFLRLLGHHRG